MRRASLLELCKQVCQQRYSDRVDEQLAAPAFAATATDDQGNAGNGNANDGAVIQHRCGDVVEDDRANDDGDDREYSETSSPRGTRNPMHHTGFSLLLFFFCSFTSALAIT